MGLDLAAVTRDGAKGRIRFWAEWRIRVISAKCALALPRPVPGHMTRLDS